MAQISRSTKINGGTTLTANTLARAADVETDMLTVFNAHNNHDAGTSAWTVVKAEGSSSIPLVANNSSGTQNIVNFQDNGTNVLSIADGGTTTVRATDGGTSKALIVNNGTSTGNILEAQDNGTAALTLADGGTLTYAPGGTTKIVGSTGGLVLSNSATIAMGSAKITGLAAATTAGDAVRYEQNKILQTLYVEDTAYSTASGTIPEDDSIPQLSEGNQILSQAITCSSSSNIIEVSGIINVSGASAGSMVVAIFQDATSNAKAVFAQRVGAGVGFAIPYYYRMTAGTTSATTVKIIVGNSAGACHFNSANGSAREYGGASVCNLTLRELQS